MKTPKLSRKSSKSASNDVSPSLSQNRHEVTLKTSLDELNHPSSRELLRQHFTGAFPETTRKDVQEWDHSGSGMEQSRGPLSRSTSSLNVGQNAAAASSSSTIDTAGVNGKRLSTVQESQQAIDIAQAIQLLQELKKSASPQELVALHKALLPTRDSLVPSPAPVAVNRDGSSDIFNSQSVIRRGSMLPAGFATRGGASEDPLRRLEEVKPAAKRGKSKSRDSLTLKKKESKSSIAALDLADDTTPSKYARAATPSNEDYTPLGNYRPGTLRITNGAASPDPSLATRPSMELSAIEPTPPSMRESGDYATAPTTPVPRPSLDSHPVRSSLHRSMTADNTPSSAYASAPTPSEFAMPGSQDQGTPELPRQGRSRNSSISGIPHPEKRDESVPRIYKRVRPQRSRDASQTRTPQPRQRSQSATPQSREPSLSRIPVKVASRASLSGNTGMVAHKVSEQSLSAPIRRSLDDGRVSPMIDDFPRFAQRISHRASHLPSEALPDTGSAATPQGELPSSYTDREALLNRLSTVYDRDDDETTAHETPEAALSKLTGDAHEGPSKQSSDTSVRYSVDTSTPSRRVVNNIRLGRPTPQKADSGYGTDGSSQEQQGTKANNQNNKTSNVDEGISIDDEEPRTLYSLHEILNSSEPGSPLGLSSPRTPATNKKHTSFQRLTSAFKGDSSLTLAMLSSPAANDAPASSPLEQRDGKGYKKKLQKPMPDSVKREFKEKRKKEKEEQAARAPILCEGFVQPDTPEMDTPDTRSRRFSWEPQTALPTPTVPKFKSTAIHLVPQSLEANGDTSFNAGEEAPLASTPGIVRKRSKSLGLALTPGSPQVGTPSSQDSGQAHRSRSLKRKRPARRATDNGPVRPAGLDVRGISCLKPNPDDGDDEAPMWTDHSSVSQSLGCNPYDISTTMFRRTVALPGVVTTTISSPHQITTSVSRTKTGGLQGMDSSMASELARMKSRDIAISNNEQVYERPRMATPKSRSAAQLENNERAVRFPNTAAEEGAFARRDSVEPTPGTPAYPVELSTRPMSTYAESIPPLPELPADVRRVISKVDVMVAKRIREDPKDSTQPSPNDSGRSSEDKGCDSTTSVADAVRKALESRRKSEVKLTDGERVTGLRKRPSGPRKQSSGLLQARIQHVLRPKSSESIQIGLGSDVETGGSPMTAGRNGDHTPEKVPSDWSRHAEVWKERRKSAGLSLAKPFIFDDVTPSPISPLSPMTTTPRSPAIMVSRYITPHANAIPPQHDGRRRKSAADQADAYRALIGDDEMVRSESPASIISPVVPSPIQQHQQQQQHSHTLLSTNPSDFQALPRSRSPGGRVITPSGNFHPYTPADAPTAEQSRAISLAKLTAATRDRELGVRGTQSLDMARGDPAARQQQMPPRRSDDRTALPSVMTKDPLFDRYSGGLQYGFERGAGLGGSAGTRGNGDVAQRRSKELSVGWGVDLSDVPVFLARVEG